MSSTLHSHLCLTDCDNCTINLFPALMNHVLSYNIRKATERTLSVICPTVVQVGQLPRSRLGGLTAVGTVGKTEDG